MHFLVEFGMQLFLNNLGTLIPNLPHAKLYFVFFLLKIQKQNGRQNLWKCYNCTSGLGSQWTQKHHLVSKMTFFGVRELRYDVSKCHLATIIINQWPLEGKIQNGRHCNVICLNFASK